VNHDDSRVFD